MTIGKHTTRNSRGPSGLFGAIHRSDAQVERFVRPLCFILPFDSDLPTLQRNESRCKAGE